MPVNMIPIVLTVVLLPALILADTQCPSGDLSCPEGKTCCTVEGRSSCCDVEDSGALLPHHSPLRHPNSPDIVVQNGTWGFGGCDFRNCGGTCCGGTCCPVKMATCCSGDNCCEFGATCCTNGCCGIMTPKCCESWCCSRNSKTCGTWERKCAAAATLAPATAMISMVLLWLAIKMVSDRE